MLQFALKYKDAVKMVTLDLSNNLWKYELDNKEWVIAKELATTLKVRLFIVLSYRDFTQFSLLFLSVYCSFLFIVLSYHDFSKFMC